MFSNQVYDILKWIAQYLLPAAGTLYFALAGIWGFPYGEEIVDRAKKLWSKLQSGCSCCCTMSASFDPEEEDAEDTEETETAEESAEEAETASEPAAPAGHCGAENAGHRQEQATEEKHTVNHHKRFEPFVFSVFRANAKPRKKC